MIERLTPNTFVELNNVISGGRKIALVDDTGLGYFELLSSSELPKPLQSDLLPQELGSIASWLEQQPSGFCVQLTDAWKYLSEKNYDVLTIARALRWGVENNSADHDLLEKMGLAATEQIRRGQQIVTEAMQS